LLDCTDPDLFDWIFAGIAPLPEADTDALPSIPARRRIGSLGRPIPQPWCDHPRDQLRRPGAPIFPGQIAIPALPAGVVLSSLRLSGQPEITDRDHAPVRAIMRAIAIGEGVELLDVIFVVTRWRELSQARQLARSVIKLPVDFLPVFRRATLDGINHGENG
jgi:hypothetical protein